MIDYYKNEPELVLAYAQKWVRRIQRKDFTLKEFRTYMVHKDIFTAAEKDFIVGYVLKSVPVFCKPFLDKVAKHFWTLLHVQIGQNCKVLVSLIKQADHSLADII